MASGYVTSDVKDLDSRYLAIGGKAASASQADTATKANSVAWSAVSGKPSMVMRYPSAAAVNVNKATLPWTAPSNCVVGDLHVLAGGNSNTNRIIYIDGVNVYNKETYQDFDVVLHAGFAFMKKGAKISSNTSNQLTFKYSSYAIS